MAGALLFVEKISTILVRLRDVGNSSNILLTSRNPKTTVDFPAFFKHASAEKIAVCAHTNRDLNKQEVFSKPKLKSQKSIVVGDFF